MLFNSIDFLIFFPIAVLGYYAIPHRVRYIWLLICSYYFYMCWNPAYALLILTSTAVTYASGLVIGKVKGSSFPEEKKTLYRRCSVALSFLINLGLLAYFKYFTFFMKNILTVLSIIHIQMEMPSFDILLPVGISFYTFQALSYTADVYRGDVEPERNFLKYALFVSFFPQLVAGPIERPGDLLSQIDEYHPFRFENVQRGVYLMLWGYFLKMVIADKTAVLVDTVYNDFETYGGWYLIVATVFFAVQIYCDFFGYSTIALGAAKVMGFRLTDNFHVPYMSRSTSEFWRRWHITLFNWLRDYLYIPLGGGRKGKMRKYANILIVFFASGLWHGAAWRYVIWGVLNGLWQVIGDICRPVREKLKSLLQVDPEAFSHKLLQMIITFLLIDFTLIFFRARTMWEAFGIINSMVHADNLWIFFDDSLFSLGLDWKNSVILFLSIEVLVIADFLKYKGIVIHEAIARQGIWFRWSVLIIGFVSILLFGIWGSGYDEAAFIYFQF